MGWSPPHGRIKEKYDPKPNAAELRHKLRIKALHCVACGAWPSEAHHVMQPHPRKRFRRDHRFLLAVCNECHRGTEGIHGIGRESEWAAMLAIDTAGWAWNEWLLSEELNCG